MPADRQPDLKGAQTGAAIDYCFLADQLPALIAYVDAEQRYRYANTAYGDWVGVEPSDIIGRSVADLLGSELYSSIRRHIDKALSGEEVSYEVRTSFESRGMRWLGVRYVPDVTDRKVRGFYALVTDITDKKVAEKLLRDNADQAHSLMRAIVETVVEGIITIDEQGTVGDINRAAQKIFGYTAEEVCGHNVKMLMPEPYSSEHDQHIARFLDTGESSIIGTVREVAGRRKDGTTFPVEISVSEMVWDDRRHFAGILRDLTEKRRLEQEFLHAQKMEAIGRLAGSIAHDFNNLLMGMIGGCRLAASKLGDTHAARAPLDDVSAAAERGAELVRQLLTFSRKKRISPEPIELNDVVESARSMIERLVGENIGVAIELAQSGGPVVADAVQIEQVLMNLVVNARDAMPAGGKLTIQTTDLEMSDTTRRAGLDSGAYVALVVQDTGIGMDAKTAARVFEPFFTTKGPGEGTGLGLSTVYGIVVQLGGNIEVTSTPGEGSTFRVFLRRSDRQSPTPSRTPEASNATADGETILVVDDDALVRSAIRYGLEMRGYRVLEARDAVQARRVCSDQETKIKLLLTDIVLPGLSGPELAREIETAHPGVAILYMSAYPHDHLVESGKLQRNQPSLEKPFTDDALQQRIYECLAGRDPNRPGQPAT